MIWPRIKGLDLPGNKNSLSFLPRFFPSLTGLLTLAFMLTHMFGCATLRPRSASAPFSQEGLASWYGPEFHGKPTSSREIYDMHQMTAAHPTLPFGTYVMVTNLNNGRSAVVRINDRGPFVAGRIIDLSYAAARVLDAVGPGVIPVRIEVLAGVSSEPKLPVYYLQLGAFVVEANARALYEELIPKYPDVFISPFVTSQATYFRVRIKAADREQAMRLAQVLSEEGRVVLLIEE